MNSKEARVFVCQNECSQLGNVAKSIFFVPRISLALPCMGGGEGRSLREQVSGIKQYHSLPHPRMSCLPGFITLWAGKMGFEPLWVSLGWASGGRLERVVYGAVMMFSFLIDDDDPCNFQCDLESTFINSVSRLPTVFVSRIRNSYTFLECLLFPFSTVLLPQNLGFNFPFFVKFVSLSCSNLGLTALPSPSALPSILWTKLPAMLSG